MTIISMRYWICARSWPQIIDVQHADPLTPNSIEDKSALCSASRQISVLALVLCSQPVTKATFLFIFRTSVTVNPSKILLSSFHFWAFLSAWYTTPIFYATREIIVLNKLFIYLELVKYSNESSSHVWSSVVQRKLVRRWPKSPC